MKTVSIVQSTSTLFKIKHLPEDYISIAIFGPLGFFRTIIRASCFFSNNGIYLTLFSSFLLNNLKNKLSYGSSVSYFINIGTLHLFKGYRAVVRVIGVGYKIEMLKSNALSISLGYSHKINVQLPTYLKIHILKKRTIIWSYSLKRVQEFCKFLFNLKKRDVYNGKGIIQPHLQKKLKIGKISRI